MRRIAKQAIGGSAAAVGTGAALTMAARTALFRAPKEEPRAPQPVDVDMDAAVHALSSLIRCKTVSNVDHALEDDAEFERLVALLPELYPRVFETCTLTRMDDRALLLRWPGAEPGNPAVLMAHYDVVPVDEQAWTHDPFCGEVIDGALWGRGALDTKVTFNGVLFSANALIAEGFVPVHDVYFAFSGCEEVYGPGASHIVEWFAEQGIVPELVLDEGGAVVRDVFPGLDRPCGLIGIAEKGFMNVRFEATSNGGHASAPKPHSPVAALAEAVDAIETHPMPLRLSSPVRQMFDCLGRHTTPLYRTVFANVDLFLGVLDALTRKSGGNLNALLRTTVAFTQMQGSSANNVIPPSASVVANIRINPEDTSEGVMAYLRKTVNDPEVSITAFDVNEPSPVSRTDCEGYRRVASAVADTWTDCIVSPYVMVQCSDSRHYRDLSDRVYRFSAYDATSEELATIHGNDERIRLEALRRSIEFFTRVLRQC
jgi:carboxypeptidase PM20D1